MSGGLAHDAGRPFWSYYRLDLVCLALLISGGVGFGVWFFKNKGISKDEFAKVMATRPDITETLKVLGRPRSEQYIPRPDKPKKASSPYVNVYLYDLRGPEAAFVYFDMSGGYERYVVKQDAAVAELKIRQ